MRDVLKSHSPDYIAELYKGQRKTLKEIALLLDSSVPSIKRVLEDLGVSRRSNSEAQRGHKVSEETRAKMSSSRSLAWGGGNYRLNWMGGKYRSPEVSLKQHQIVLGTTLGDGHLSLKGVNAQMITSCKMPDKQYIDWKFKEVESTGLFRPPFSHIGKSFRVDNYESWRLESRRHPYFTGIHSLLYYQGRKKLTKPLLEQLEPLGLAVWYMDDGNLSHQRTPRISLAGFPEEEVALTRDILGEKFGLNFRLSKSIGGILHRERWTLRMNSKESHEFFHLIGEYISEIPCMSRKIP